MEPVVRLSRYGVDAVAPVRVVVERVDFLCKRIPEGGIGLPVLPQSPQPTDSRRRGRGCAIAIERRCRKRLTSIPAETSAVADLRRGRPSENIGHRVPTIRTD